MSAQVSSKESTTIRHAEKRRNSTCALADAIAKAALDAWRSLDVRTSRQTVVAAIVLQHQGGCTCLSLGAGTKTPSRAAVVAGGDGALRDCHAEVLAVRAFRRYLYAALEDNGCDAFEKTAAGVRLRPGAALFLYCSSAPCGNSTIRRWAKTTREVFRPELGTGPPPERHAPFKALTPAQVALLGKRRPDDDAADEGVPPGCAPLDGDALRPHCCSDKVARWCAVGLAGALLSRRVEGAALAGIVVGRKYCFEHARRAFCCRVPHLQRHPALMGTGLLLDEGVYVDNDGADFRDGRCYAWCRGDARAEELDGSAGATAGGAPSTLCRAAFLERYRALVRDAPASYGDAKRAAASEAFAAADRALRFSAGAPFSEWLASNV